MTQTLTTKVLNDFITMQGYGVAPSAVEAMAREILANREAQPVAGECDQDVYANGTSACLVVIPKETAEVICRGISAVTGCKVDWHYIGGRVHIKAIAPPAPALQKDVEAVVSLLEAGEWAEHCTNTEVGQRLESAVTALVSDATPAPAALDGWQIVPVEPTCSMCSAGREAIRSVEYQSDIARTVYKAMLAAAPEGCNDA